MKQTWVQIRRTVFSLRLASSDNVICEKQPKRSAYWTFE